MANDAGRVTVEYDSGGTHDRTRNRYSAVSMTLHWLIAVLVIGQVLLISAHDAREGPTAPVDRAAHKSNRHLRSSC